MSESELKLLLPLGTELKKYLIIYLSVFLKMYPTYPDNQRSNEVPVHQKTNTEKFPNSQFKIINLMCLWTFGRSQKKPTELQERHTERNEPGGRSKLENLKAKSSMMPAPHLSLWILCENTLNLTFTYTAEFLIVSCA